MRKMHMDINTPNPYHKEGGAVLVVGLIILGVLMMGAMAMMQTSLQDERIVANKRLQTQAFLTAERGIYHAQKELTDNWDGSNCAVDPNFQDGDILSVNGTSFNEIKLDQNDPIKGHYTVRVSDCTGSSPAPVLESKAYLNGAEVTLKAEYQPPSNSGFGFVDPPAAISCFGGPCSISIGNGNGTSGISGFDHTPPDYCNGSSCWVKPDDGKKMKPAVFMSVSGGALDTGGGFYCGADYNDPNAIYDKSKFSQKGNGKKVTENNGSCKRVSSDNGFYSNWEGHHFKDEEGKEKPPLASDYIDIFKDQSVIDSASDEWGKPGSEKLVYISEENKLSYDKTSINAGVMVVDGTDYSISGTRGFSGIIVLQNCATFGAGGNFQVYGAILVDATTTNEKGEVDDCGPDYNPFAGWGTPAVRFSSKAAQGAEGAMPPQGSGSLVNWQHFLND